MAETLAPRTVGELFGQGFRLTFANIVSLIAIQLIFQGPVLLLWSVMESEVTGVVVEDEGDMNPLQSLLLLGGVALGFLLMPLSQAATIVVIANDFLDRPKSLRAGLGTALRKLFPLLFVGITKNLIAFVWYLPGMLTMGVGLSLDREVGVVLMLIGGGLLIGGVVMSIRVLLACSVAEACVVVQNDGVFEALRRSRALTKNSMIRILALGLMLSLVMLMLAIPVNAAGLAGSTMLSSPYASWAIQVVLNMISGALFTVFLVIVYFDLRVRNDSFDLDHLADLVDVIAERSRIPTSSTTPTEGRFDEDARRNI